MSWQWWLVILVVVLAPVYGFLQGFFFALGESVGRWRPMPSGGPRTKEKRVCQKAKDQA